MHYSADIKKLPRHFLPEKINIDSWETLAPFFKDLEERVIGSVAEMEQWLKM